MDPKYINFFNTSNARITNPLDRAKVTSLAIAKAISNKLHLPTTEVTEPQSHYNLQVSQEARILIGQFNENLIFDAKACADYVRMFWMLRYVGAHPLSRPLYAADYGFFDIISGVGLFVPNDLHTFCTDNAQAILMLSVIAGEIIPQLQG